MSKDIRVAVMDGHFAIETAEMFLKKGFTLVNEPARADLLVFVGGEDVNPLLYKQACAKTTHINTKRDLGEKHIFEAFPDLPKVGICRGGQLLNVLSGGEMWQDVDNHGKAHPLWDMRTRQIFLTTSMHHQMMIPSKGAIPIARANKAQYFMKMDNDSNPITIELNDEPRAWTDMEVCYYPKTRSLCFQPHPELGTGVEREYFFSLIEDYCGIRAPLGPAQRLKTLVSPHVYDNVEGEYGVEKGGTIQLGADERSENGG